MVVSSSGSQDSPRITWEVSSFSSSWRGSLGALLFLLLDRLFGSPPPSGEALWVLLSSSSPCRGSLGLPTPDAFLCDPALALGLDSDFRGHFQPLAL